MQTTLYKRKPLEVEAIQVTEDNFYEVAEWCGGDIITNTKKHIFIKVIHPLHAKQSRAQVGDWVLKSDQGFKIYADSAFRKGFEEVDAVKIAEVLKDGLMTPTEVLTFQSPPS